MRQKTWIVVMVTFTLGTLCLAFGGDYVVNLDRIDNHDEMSREFADWHFFGERTNKEAQKFRGYYRIKKLITNPRTTFAAYVLSNNKFHKMAMSDVLKVNMCSESFKKIFVNELFKGNSTWETTDSGCTIHPGYMRTATNLTVNDVAHKLTSKIIYGTYKIQIKIINGDESTIAAVTLMMTTKKSV